MNKITFMGAGSTVFVRNVLGDCMCSDALKDWEYALYDIDATRLEESFEIISAMNETKGGHARITKHLGVENRKEALRGANYVVNAIQVGLYEPCTVTDFEVPKKYGLRQTIADTLGIGGIFRALPGAASHSAAAFSSQPGASQKQSSKMSAGISEHSSSNCASFRRPPSI